MAEHFSYEEKFDMLCCFIKSHKNAEQAERQYLHRYPERRQPNKSIFHRLVSNLKNHGSFNKPIINRNKLVNSEYQLNVLLAVNENDTISTRCIEREHGVPKSTTQRILSRENYHPYKYRVCHSLLPGDRPRRRTFCEWFTRKCDEDEHFSSKILWSDETYISNNGVFNRRNQHYWSTHNQFRIRPLRHQNRFGFNVWCGIMGRNIVGPIFYEGTLTSERYFQILTNDLEDLLDNIPLAEVNNIWYQQDGAPSHNSHNVMNYLLQRFNNKVVATNSAVRWPARSPDLTPLDFFLWGFIKDKVYWRDFENVGELRAEVQAAFSKITPRMLSNVMDETVRRCYLCLENEGNIFEHEKY